MNKYLILDSAGFVYRMDFADEPPDVEQGWSVVPWEGEDNPWAQPNQEGKTLTFSDGVLAWSDLRSLEERKTVKNLEINAARLAANQSSFTYLGKQIAVDPLSRSDIDAANGIITLTGALPPGWPGAWKAMDNTYVPITDLATWAAFYGAMVAAGTTNFTHAQTLKAAVLLAETVEEIDAISW